MQAAHSLTAKSPLSKPRQEDIAQSDDRVYGRLIYEESTRMRRLR